MPLHRGLLTLLVLLGVHPGPAAERVQLAPQPPQVEGSSAAPRVVAPPLLADVEAAFARIPERGEQLAVTTGRRIPQPWYRASPRNAFGFRNHFQGIQRLPHSDYLVVSGSNQHAPMSSLFVFGLPSHEATGALVTTIEIDPVLWHAGGLSVLDNTLAVPIFGTHPLHARIVFYDVGRPEAPRKLPVQIDRPGRKAYAVALTRLPSRHVLVAVLSARDGLPRRVDFYLSRSPDLADGFHAGTTWLASDLQARPGQDRNFSDFQGLSLVAQADGRLFLAGFHNSMPSLPIIPGRDYADLYEVAFPPDTTTSLTPRLRTPRLTKIASRRFYCKDGFCNMDAAAGLHVDPQAQVLHVYAAGVWLHQDRIRFTAFRPIADRASQPK